MISYANTRNISIYALDPDTFTRYFITSSAELGPRERMTSFFFRRDNKIKRIQNLTWMSEDTGAVSLKGAQKYERFYEVLSTDLNYYYELSFYPQREEADDRPHKIRVKVNRPGVDVRSRKGYTDYSGSEKEKILLVSAFYNPGLFKQLPFEGGFAPFHKESQTYVPMKFFPAVTNRFQRMQDATVFLQVYLPQGKREVKPKFKVSGEGRLTQRLPAELVAEKWDKKSNVWSGFFNLQLRNVIHGEYTLNVEIPDSGDDAALSRQVRLIKLRY